MEDSSVHEIIDTCSSKCTLGFLARNPPLAVIVLILCGIVLLPAVAFVLLTIVALFLTHIEILEIPGEMMLFKILFSGFLISVGIILFVTSGIIIAWYYGLSRMYKVHFNLKKTKYAVDKKRTQ